MLLQHKTNIVHSCAHGGSNKYVFSQFQFQSINLFRHTQQIYTIYKTKVTKTFILCVTGSTQGA